MGEVLIINVSYLLEDAVELMMQYFYFDKYAGVRRGLAVFVQQLFNQTRNFWKFGKIFKVS